MQIINEIIRIVGAFTDNEATETSVKAAFASLHDRLVKVINSIGYTNHAKLSETFKTAFETAEAAGLFGSPLELTPSGQSRVKSRKQNLTRRINTAWKAIQKEAGESVFYKFKGATFIVVIEKPKVKKTLDEDIQAVLERHGKPFDSDTLLSIAAAIAENEKRLEKMKKDLLKEIKPAVDKMKAEKVFREMNAAGIKWSPENLIKFSGLKGKKVTEKQAKTMVALI